MNHLRSAVRQFRKYPGFTAIVVLTLAIGIGANTAIFSIVNTTFLRALPYPDADRLVHVSESSKQWNDMSVSYPNFLDWLEAQDVFAALAMYRTDGLKLQTPGGAERIDVGYVTGEFFAAVGLRAALGRDLEKADDTPGAAPVMWISHALWQRSFAGDTTLVGRTVLLDQQPVTVAGILPAHFQFHRHLEALVPLAPFTEALFMRQRENHNGTYVIGRLRAGVSIGQARAQMEAIGRRLAEQYPGANAGIGVRVVPLRERFAGDARNNLLLLAGAVGMVLLIACVNVANMLLARAGLREREMAIRTSLGATRGELIRQLLAESLLLALVGGSLGVLLGTWGYDFARRLVPWEVRNVIDDGSGIDGRVLLFASVLVIITGLGFGLAPAWRLSQTNPNEALKNTKRPLRTAFGRIHMADALVVAQVALALMLLVGAGLMIRSMLRLVEVPSGLQPEHVLTLRVSPPAMEDYRRNPLGYVAFHERILEAVQRLPEVDRAAFGSALPFSWNTSSSWVFRPDRPAPAPGEFPAVNSHVITPDYFQALGIPLLQGRNFDGHEPQPVMPPGGVVNQETIVEIYRDLEIHSLISQRMADLLWPGEDPAGKQFQMGQPEMNLPRFRVIGIVGNTMQQGLDQAAPPEFYATLRQFPAPMYLHLVIRSRLDPAAIVPAVREAVRAVAPHEPVFDVRVMSDRIADAMSGRRFNMTLFTFFGGVALLLAGIGIYGVLAFDVSRRTREVGIRMALGAQRADILRAVLRHGVLLFLPGAALGLLGAWAGSRLIETQLFGVRGTDPWTYGVGAALLFLVALSGCAIPARRAASIDPNEALRTE